MALNRYDNPAQQTYVDQYVPVPFEEMTRALAMRQKKYDDTRDEMDGLEDSFLKIQALEQDKAKRKQLVDGYHSEMEKAVDSVKGDYSKLSENARQIARRIKKDVTYGPLGAIHGNYQTYVKAKEEFDKMKSEGKFMGQEDIAQYNALTKALQSYQGIGEEHEGTFNQFTPGKVGPYYDISKETSDAVQQWASDKGYGALKFDEKSGTFYSTTTHEYVDPKEVRAGALEYVRSNPKYKGQLNDYVSYYDQEGEGKGNEHLQKYLGDLSGMLGRREGFDKYGIDYMADPLAGEKYKKKQEEIQNIAKEVVAPKYGTTTDNVKLLQESINGIKTSGETELTKILSITPGLIPGNGSIKPEQWIASLNDKYKGGALQWAKDNLNKIPSDRRGVIKATIDNYEDVQQRNTDAENYALEQIKLHGTKEERTEVESDKKLLEAVKGLDIHNPYAIQAELEKLGIKSYHKFTAEEIANNPTQSATLSMNNLSKLLESKGFKPGNTGTTPYLYTSRLQKLMTPEGSNETALGKYKDKYLTETANKKMNTQWAESVIVPITYDNKTGKYVGNEQSGQDMTQYINKLLTNGGLDSLPTDMVAEDGTTKLTLGQVLQALTPEDMAKKGNVIDRPKNIFFTRLPGEDGVQQLVVDIAGKEIKINASTLQVKDPNNENKMVPLSEVQNAPINRLNNRVYRAYSNGVKDINIGEGIKLTLPQDIDDKAVMNGTYANSSNLKVTVAPEDVTKYGKNLVGASAIKYLQLKNHLAEAQGKSLF